MPADRDELQRFIEAQRADYAATLPAKLAEMERLCADAATPASLHALERAAHGMYGAAGTFGFGEVSRAAFALEEAAQALQAADAASAGPARERVVQALAQLKLNLPVPP